MKCTKMKSARKKRANHCFSSLNMQICDKVVAVVVVVAYTPYSKMAANKLFFCLHVN